MSIFQRSDKLQKWRYEVTSLKLLFPEEEPLVIPCERINAIEIINDYENNFYPIFKITIVMGSTLYYNIIKYKDSVKFYLRVQRYYQYSDSDEKSLYRDYISDTFDLILDDNDSDMKINMKREEASNDFTNIVNDDNDDLVLSDNPIEFYLFKKSIIKGMKKTINKVLSNATVMDALMCVFKKAGLKNIIISPVTNKNKYEELLIPKMSCIKALQFIDTYYGLYKTGTLMFFDFTRSYILSYDGKSTAYSTNERRETVIVVPMETQKHTVEPGVLKKKQNTDKFYIVADYKTISIRNESESNDVINGNNVEVIDNYTGEVVSSKSDAYSSGGSSEKVMENVTVNKWLSDTYTAQTSANDVVIDMHLSNYCVDYLKPNKKFQILFEDPSLVSKYQGTYTIVYANHGFLQDGDDFSLTSVIRFKKIK